MLNRTKYALFAGALVLGSLWAGVGCTIKEVDPVDRPSTTSTTTTTVTTTSTGPGGGGGEGGSNNVGGNGGAGGGVVCVGIDGTGLNDDACDGMQIAPASVGGPASSICGVGMNEDPPGYQVCLDGFAVYTPGSAENLQACLDTIGVEPANACDENLVFDCLDKVYAEACPRAEIDTLCTDFETGCVNVGQTFDVPKCSVDLAPLSNVGLEEYENCVNIQPDAATCQEAHDACAG
jgi:hypothetical protein